MLLIKNRTQNFMSSQTVSHKWEQKHRLRDTYINKDCENVTKFMKITSNSTQQAEKTKSAER